MTWQSKLLNINGRKACDSALGWAARYASFADAYDACTDKSWKAFQAGAQASS